MTECCKFIIDFLDCDCELFEQEKNEDKIIDRWNDLTVQGKKEGFFPLLIVPGETLVEWLEFTLEEEDLENTPENIAALREGILTKAAGIDAREFLDKRLDEYTKDYDDMDILGEFRACEPDDCFYCHMDGDNPHPEIIIAKIPAKNPWELAAWLPMGGFNDCPLPAEQVAVFKYWHEKYGAIPGVATYETWEMELTGPPADDEAAEALAKEHFAFCGDTVGQADEGWDTIRALASSLKNSTTWYFWWD